MTPQRWREIRHVVESALERTPAERRAYLEQACGDDAHLRAEVESLVAAHDSDPGFLEGSGPAARLADPTPASVGPGSSLGPYRVERRIAAGGMGAVFLASRADDAFHKQVAVKVIRSDPLSSPREQDELLRRFRTERQTLANLDHPHIARLLDGGATADGLPYLVMEHVDGLPIDAFCEAKGLTTDARLAVFHKVCEAVHFAHQKLVVHRDLKPGNILVTHDGVPKLLDFGLAKLLDAGASPSAAVTRSGAQPMTPAYASPEQIRGEPITTATDVYSLGVVLYELLTGRRPYPTEGCPPHEIARLICEHEPSRPSEMVTRSAPVDIAANRPPSSAAVSLATRGRPAALRRRLSGDLDMIVLTALRKEPARRYRSVEQLAEDIRRHLDGEPITARPSTAGYRAGKFVRRHRVGVGAALLVVLSLAGGVVGTAWQARVAEQRRNEAEAITAFLIDLLKLNNPEDDDGGRRRRRELLTVDEVLRRGVARIDSLSDQPLLQARLQNTLGLVLGRMQEPAEALAMHERALATRRRALGDGHVDTINSMNNAANSLIELERWKEAESLLREALALCSTHLDTDPRLPPDIRHNLARVLRKLGRLDESETAFRAALDAYAGMPEPSPPRMAKALNNLGALLRERKKLADAEDLLRRAVEQRSGLYGPRHAATLVSINNLALTLADAGRLAEAEPLFREAYDGARESLGDNDPETLTHGNNLAHCLLKLDRLAEAEPIFRATVAAAETTLRPENLNLALYRGNFGDCLTRLGRCDEAGPLLEAAFAATRPRYEISHPRNVKTLQRLIAYHQACGTPEQAEAYRSLLADGEEASE